MVANNSFDLIVVGSGPGGYVAAIRAAQLGLKTAIVERDRLGGVCLNWGCIPSKALLTNARVYGQILEAGEWGIQVGEVDFNIDHIIGRSRKVADSLSKGVSYLMKKNEIEVFEGTASFNSDGHLTVRDEKAGDQQISADHIIIATGAKTRTIPGIEVDGEKILTSRHALELRRIPESIIVIGGGAIGCEFAYFYNSFGAEVTMVEMLDQLLPHEDHEIGAELQKSFKKRRMEILLNTKVSNSKKTKSSVTLTIEDQGGNSRELQAELALNAVGVFANTETLNLEQIGIKLEKGNIKVDRWYRTTRPGVYAIGDVIGPPWLAHVASHEGIVCVEKLAGEDPHPMDYLTVPAATYCQPQVASVGLTEKKARDQGYSIKVGKFPFQVLGKARASRATDGFVKLIFDERYGELLGAHIIGEEATEMIAELVTAKALETTYLDLLKTVHAHPTLSEATMEAAGAAYGEQIHL